MPKFFIQPDQICDRSVIFHGSDYTHIKTVLRAVPGDEITACNGLGQDFLCKISSISDVTVTAEIIKSLETGTEPSVKVTLFQSLPKLDKMELIIQKCVELGVHEIVPMTTTRSVVKLNPAEERGEKKISRWQKIAEAAAKQSGRGIIPRIGSITPYRDCIAMAGAFDASIIPYELEVNRSLKDVCKSFSGNHIGIFIGPEGGFDPSEISLAIHNQIIPCSLGKRILRTETAGFYTLSVLLYEMED